MRYEPMRIFEKPDALLKRVECPSCGCFTTVFCETGGAVFAVDDDGVPHIVRCALTVDDVQECLRLLRTVGPAYDLQRLQCRAILNMKKGTNFL